jgi:hypothetical protein
MRNDGLQFILREKKKKKEQRGSTDWNQIKKEWFNKIEKFYKLVKGYLKEFEDEDLLSLTKNKIEIREENIGRYIADQLIIELPDQEVKLTPKGTLIVGAKGRIDMEGAMGEVRFVLVPESAESVGFRVVEGTEKKDQKEETGQEEYVWKYSTDPPEIKMYDLSQELFLELLEKVINE